MTIPYLIATGLMLGVSAAFAVVRCVRRRDRADYIDMAGMSARLYAADKLRGFEA